MFSLCRKKEREVRFADLRGQAAKSRVCFPCILWLLRPWAVVEAGLLIYYIHSSTSRSRADASKMFRF